MSLNHFKSLAITPVPASLYYVPALFSISDTPNYYNYWIVNDRIHIEMNYSIQCTSTSGYTISVDVPLPPGIKRYTTGEPDTNACMCVSRIDGGAIFLPYGTLGLTNTDKMVCLLRSANFGVAGQIFDVIINCSCRITTVV
jgi:hypothetical protein